MLLRLEIKNFVLIKSAVLEFCPTLNIITGETGAGKSLILSSLEACLGAKTSPQQILSGQTNATITCVLKSSSSIKESLKLLGIPSHEEIILRREISRDGRSRCFINDTYCSITSTKSMGIQLIDIHGQHAYHTLLDHTVQRNWLDVFADVKEELEKYKIQYKEWNSIDKKLMEFQQKKQNLKTDREYTNFCIQELQQGLIEPNRYKEISESIQSLEIEKKTSDFANKLFDFCWQQLNSLKGFIQLRKTLSQENVHLIIKLEELLVATNEIKNLIGPLQKSSEEEINQNIDQLHSTLAKVDKLKRKYEVPLNKLWELLESLQSSLHMLENIEDVLQTLEDKKKFYQEICTKLALSIREKRMKSSTLFCKEIKKKMALLGMSHSVFTIIFEPLARLSESGLDHVEFYYSPSEKIPHKKLQSIASGGELSRISLALHCVLGTKKSSQVLFFDEIDTGIGGESALHMGKLLQQLSDQNQIVLITHVPQVAKFSRKHFFVHKNTPEISDIQALSFDQKVKEIARMIKGDSPTQEDLLFANRFITQT